ncbi:MAG: DUF3828 domain-containing protein [Candidatus Accumulibacter necessarius]|jgi:hypothetical protein|uniref:DUF3828 domain-containing protein n=1 Tax=Candidatus Accumulibacter necessarius TaxID=2954386 RepID=UPI002FC307B1
MKNHTNRFAITLVCLGMVLGSEAVRAQADHRIEPHWRITHTVTAPWAPAAASPNMAQPAWVGHALTFQTNAVRGPGVLTCGHAVIEPTHYPAEGLFQGSLPAPAATAARALGIMLLPLAGVRLTCDTGMFEFHRVDADTLLLGLDNQVFILSKAPGALAEANSPEGRVQRLLEAHFKGDMGFTPASTERKREWLSKRLKHRVAHYFAKPVSADEAPVINGDPFTDSQEYPTRFAVNKASVRGSSAEVPVRFADAYRNRNVTYRLVRERGVWRLDDLVYEQGEALQGLLK